MHNATHVGAVVSAGSNVETFGNYELLEKIATGGMAEVFRVRQRGEMGFEKILVIKRILDTLAKDEEFKELFRAEARIASKLVSTNIVQVFELGQQGESLYIAMEFVHGIDLSRLLTRARTLGDFPIPLALFMMCEVLKGLSFAHTCVDEDGSPLGVVHCDISPQNILLSHSGEVKLTDFGISRAAAERANQDVIRGKYAYMSPEQVEGRPLDGRSDLFSLGIVLYEMLTGRRLFKSRSRDETLARVRRAEVPSCRAVRPDISEDLEQFLYTALARLPQDRFANAAQMLEALQRLMIREGHRASNSDLSGFIKAALDASEALQAAEPAARARLRGSAPAPVVALALEAAPPPRSLSAPSASLAALGQEWQAVVADTGGQVWERGDGAMLVVWTAHLEANEVIARAVRTALSLQRLTAQSGYQLSAGIAPGMARLSPDTGRPPDGWELSGPFYLSRWMMNLSAHRGRVLMTEVGARHVDAPCTLLGRIPIQGSRFINLYEVG